MDLNTLVQLKNNAKSFQYNVETDLTLLHLEGPKLYGVLALLSAIGLRL